MPDLLLKDIEKIYRLSDEKNPIPLSILIRDGIIQEIGEYEEIHKNIDKKNLKDITVLDCSDSIALPGFVDSHTHLLFYGSREQ